MKELPLRLRVYLWGIYLAFVVLVAQQVCLLGRVDAGVPTLTSAAVFVLLTYIGERISLQISGAVTQSLSTAIHVAAILVLPQPYPLVISLGAVVVSHGFDHGRPLYKRAFNVCHPTLTVGLATALLGLVAAPTTVLRAHHLVNAFPYLALVLVVYYALDVGILLAVLSLADAAAPWQVWLSTYRPTLLPELAASTIGILGAIAWQYDPLALTLLVFPIVALRIAYRAINQAEDRGAALRRRGEQLEAVLAAGQRLRLQPASGDLLAPVAEAARAVSGAAVVTSYLRDEESPTTLRRVAVSPAEAMAVGPAAMPVSAARHGVEQLADDGGPRTLIVPLEVEGEGVLGLLHLTDMPSSLGHDDRDALTILATQAAIALQNARLHERALAQASEDGLTGLTNHRAFQTRLEGEVARTRRSGRPLCLMMIDLDDFRAVNNTYGHQVGDATLQAIAAAIKSSVRASDVAARYGGDEFAVILPETDIEEALDLAHRVLSALAALQVLDSGVTIRIAASLGVAALTLHADTREELVRAADRAAYAAKRAGKGRVGRPEDAPPILPDDPVALAEQLRHANLATVEALAAAVDAKDPYTRGHSQRVSQYAEGIARALGLEAIDVARIRLAGMLHDVGKIGIPDAILTKPGALSAEEVAVVQQHPAIGERMLANVPFLRDILPAIRHHHERWDGRGYPDGLPGPAIPPDAAVLAVADAFDAMTSNRNYRLALSVSDARLRLHEGAGTQFDPDAVAAFDRAYRLGLMSALSAGNATNNTHEACELACPEVA